jgi:DNA helicase HerA-like ATPase
MASLAVRPVLYGGGHASSITIPLPLRSASVIGAYCIDGHSVGFVAPIASGIAIAGFVVVDDPNDVAARLVAHVRALTVIESDSAEGASVDSVRGTASIIGRLTEQAMTAPGMVESFSDRTVRPAHPDEVAMVAEGISGGPAAFEVGTLSGAESVRVRLKAAGFSRHTFMCGQSGSGKTYTTGVLFERLLAETTLPLFVLDPNSDHVRLGELRDESDTSQRAERYKQVTSLVTVARARSTGAPLTLCADFSDLSADLQALLLQLHPIEDLDEFDTLRRVIGSLEAPYSVRDVAVAAERLGASDELAQRLAVRISNLGLADWELWCRDGEQSITNLRLRDRRCVVLDLGSLALPAERTAVALAVLGTMWDNRAQRIPRLIAIDEAHNVLPAVTADPLLTATAELGALIAGEGRKFGIHLFVSSQRPSKVHPNVVSQCDNLVLMRMNGAADVADLERSFSHVPSSLIHEALGFGLGEALFAGPICPVPLRVHVGSRLSPEGGADLPTTWATAGS